MNAFRGLAQTIILTCLLVLAGCDLQHTNTNQPEGTTTASMNAITQPVYHRVMESKVIRAGYIVYPPASIIDPNTGKLSGIFVDTLEEAAKRLGLTVDWAEEVDWGTMIEGLNAGRYDIVGTPVWKNTTRAKEVDFSMPLYFDGVGVYVKADEERFDRDLKALNSSDNRIVSVDGGLGIEIATTRFKNAELITLPQNTDINMELDWVAAGKANASLTSMSYAWDYQQKNPGTIKNIAQKSPVAVFPNVVLLPKSEPDLVHMVDAAIEELQLNGYIDAKILEYAAESSGQYYRVAKPFRAE